MRSRLAHRQNDLIFLLFFVSIPTLHFCSPSNPSANGYHSNNNNEVEKKPDLPNIELPAPTPPPAAEREKYDTEQAETRKWAARIRLELLDEAMYAKKWTDKFTPLAQYFSHYDFQRWEPFESYRKNKSDLDVLIYDAVDDFFNIWIHKRNLLSRSILNSIDVYNNSEAVNSLLALSLTCDQINPKQERLAQKYRFRSKSLEDILFFTLQSFARGQQPASQYEQKIFENKEVGIEILQWRLNSILRWAYAQLVMAEPSARPAIGKTLTFRGRRLGDIEAILRNLQQAIIAQQRIVEISEAPQMNNDLRLRFNRLNMEKAKLELSTLPGTRKREAARDILDILERLSQSF